MNAFIPYGIYWSSPFAKWQGTLANLNALPLAAAVGKQALAARGYDLAAVDLAILAVPAALVDSALDDAIAAKVKGVVLFSSGFAEIGAEGTAAQARLGDKARAAGV
eukprot:gene46200-61782_t